MCEMLCNIDRVLEGFRQTHFGFEQAVGLLESYYRKLPPQSQAEFFDILRGKLYSEQFRHLSPNRNPHELIIRAWSTFGPVDALSNWLFGLLRWDDPVAMESWAIKIGNEFVHSLFTYRTRFSKSSLDAIKAQCVLFTADQSEQLTGTSFPRSVIEVARRLERAVDQIGFDRFAESIIGPVQPHLVSMKGQFQPALTSDEYEGILGTLRNMVRVMEQHPSAFENMCEEHLRAHFLVQLNGQYGGAATGETFNFQGKTDILMRVDGRNVFIAECKFWHGEQQLLETIDQHLSYLSWRDTKSAILVFNRNANFSDVVKKIAAAVPSHRFFSSDLGKLDETSFRYIFRHPNDADRKCVVTVMVFDIPTGRTV